MSTNVCAKFRCASLRIKKALGIFRERITRTKTKTTRVAFWDPPSGSKNELVFQRCELSLKASFGNLLSVHYDISSEVRCWLVCMGQSMVKF